MITELTSYVWRNSLVCCALLVTTFGYAQEEETAKIPDGLSELSGLELLDDQTLVGINDGGHDAELYVMELSGKLRKKVKVTNAKNKDWEDLTIDDTYLYIADLGNNANKREGLKVYKVAIEDVLSKKEVTAEKIEISYAEQEDFPPKSKADYTFDVEGIAHRNGELWLFTKPNTDPWKGMCDVYRVSTAPGEYKLSKSTSIYIGDGGWWSDAVTAADIYEDKLYLTTYNRLIVFNFAENSAIMEDETIGFSTLTQKESVVVLRENTVIVGDEKHNLLGGGKLYKIEL